MCVCVEKGKRNQTGFFFFFGVLSQRFIDPLWPILQLCAFNSLTRGQTLGLGDYWECLERYIRDQNKTRFLSVLSAFFRSWQLSTMNDTKPKDEEKRVDICLLYRHPHTYVLIYICTICLVLDIPTHLRTFGKTSAISSIMYRRTWCGRRRTDFLFLGESLSHREIAPSHKSRRRVLHVLCVCVGNHYESPALWRIIFPHHFRYEHLTSSLPPPFTHNNQPYRKNTFLPFWKTTFLTAG
jgi:hypothetical protein